MQEGITIENLIEKYLTGKASVDEISQLEEWYNSFDSQTDLYLPGSPELRQVVARKFSEIKSKLGLP